MVVGSEGPCTCWSLCLGLGSATASPVALAVTRVWMHGLTHAHQWGWRRNGSSGACSPREGPTTQQAPQVTSLIWAEPAQPGCRRGLGGEWGAPSCLRAPSQMSSHGICTRVHGRPS